MASDIVFRFAVGVPDGRRSSVWRVWTQDASKGKATNADVYLAPRNAARFAKVSLHQSGDWRWSVSTPPGTTPPDSKGAPVGQRLVRWPRPTEFADRTTIAFRLLFPESELRHLPDPKLEVQKITWLAAPQPGHATEVAAFIIRADEVVNWPGKNNLSSKLLGRVRLIDKQHLFIVYYDNALHSDLKQQIDEGKRSALAAAPRDRQFGPSDSRIHIFGWRDEDGSRFFIDAATDFSAA